MCSLGPSLHYIEILLMIEILHDFMYQNPRVMVGSCRISIIHSTDANSIWILLSSLLYSREPQTSRAPSISTRPTFLPGVYEWHLLCASGNPRGIVGTTTSDKCKKSVKCAC